METLSREKQIEELTNELIFTNNYGTLGAVANHLYEKGYRKQSEGEWTRFEVNGKNYGQAYYQHKDCEVNETQLFPSPYNFCPNCGAKMKGGAE